MTLQDRLVLENQILDRDGLSQFQVYRRQYGDGFFLSGIHRTSSENSYSLRSPIPSRYPYRRPPVYITDPNPLWGFDYRRTINSYRLSHGMHTLENGPNGEVQICHWRDDRWHSGITLNKVMIKAVLWLEAYEQHLSSGNTLSSYVSTMY